GAVALALVGDLGLATGLGLGAGVLREGETGNEQRGQGDEQKSFLHEIPRRCLLPVRPTGEPSDRVQREAGRLPTVALLVAPESGSATGCARRPYRAAARL